MFSKLKRFGNKLVGGVKRIGHKHKGKIAVIGAIGAGAAAAKYQDGAEERIRTQAGKDAERIMNALADEEQREAEQAHQNLMSGAKQQPVKSGNIGQAAKEPGLTQIAKNIPSTLQKAAKSSKDIQDASLLKKGGKIEQGAVDVLGEITKPSKKEQKRVAEEQRFLSGEMSSQEAEAYIAKKAGRKARKKSKKAKKQADKRREKEFNKDPKYKKGLYDF